MKKQIFLTFLLLLIAVVTMSAQVADSTFTDTLTGLGLSKAVAWVIVSVLGILVGKVWKQKWTDPLQIVLKIAQSIVVILLWLNDKVNNLSDKQKSSVKRAKEPGIKQKLSGLFKVFVLGLFLSGVELAASAQGLFKPVPADLFTTNQKALESSHAWIPRISAGVIANQFTYNVDTKKLDKSAFSKVGLGMSLASFIPVDGEPYNNYSLNAFVFFPVDDTGLALAATISALEYISAGVGYDFGVKKVFLLTGITYTF